MRKINAPEMPKRVTSRIGEAPPETPPGIVFLGAELIDDSAQLMKNKLEPRSTA